MAGVILKVTVCKVLLQRMLCDWLIAMSGIELPEKDANWNCWFWYWSIHKIEPIYKLAYNPGIRLPMTG